ncbi:MAG: transcription-repair coupling factor, partial [Planctomycetes bacterium]|nr:transcription-repair coupling factor [Planctomycetota bacterium]
HRFAAGACTGFGLDLASALRELERLVQANRRTIVVCHNSAEQQRFRELLQDTPLTVSPALECAIGHLNHAFQLDEIHAALIPYHEMFHRYRERRRIRRFKPARPIESFIELEKGDYVVHLSHGIARFLGMDMLERDGQWREYLVLEFEHGAKLYVPASKVELVQKYVGGTDRPPPLSTLGTQAWEEKKRRVAQACLDLAAQMLDLLAVRGSSPGIAFPPDDDWQKKFEAAFIYPETEDQLQVAAEIKKDMESARPMDRLICGDVGFGKTELAMRAAFKAVMAGKQVAVLVPTTILAQQHFRTFSERMADYPIRVEVLSRFRTPKEQKETVERLREGAADIVIGTHRLVQSDVQFHDLGLVIIDEEQRFGVEHKERLKRLRATVDVLTLTATPIPRTLHMALLGIRDVSSLTTPPQDRLSIQTRLCRFDPNTIRQAILRELSREGQVFLVHNRVHDIQTVADMLREVVPEARVGVAHGQMPERLLEQRMLDFVEQKMDVLVSTTIIESGLDIPNANTIIINNADHFGLADMHQLRGRVGRYKNRAYAYLLVPRDRPVTPDAEKRLKAIEEYSDLGAGFKIALRDLEIRGAGNILGPEQHGHIAAVGYDMYCRLLNIAVKRMKGERVPAEIETSIHMNLEAFFPDDYVADPKQKVELYRKLNQCRSESEIGQVVKELTDRFGALPPQARNVVAENRLRLIAEATGIRSLTSADNAISAHTPDAERVVQAAGRAGKGWLKAIDAQTVHIRLPRPNMTGDQIADYLKKVLQAKT